MIRAGLVVGGTLLLAQAASAATIVNGSFELGRDPGTGFTEQAAGSTAITGWTIGGFGVDYIGGYWQASDGVRSIDLSRRNAGSLSQMIATVAGKTYRVAFDMSGNPDAGIGSKLQVTTVSGSLPLIGTYVVGPANSRSNMLWSPRSYTFTAFGASSSLTFASGEFNAFGPAIDNVSISVVPEPATWALLIVGFGAVGIARRRSKVVAA